MSTPKPSARLLLFEPDVLRRWEHLQQLETADLAERAELILASAIVQARIPVPALATEHIRAMGVALTLLPPTTDASPTYVELYHGREWGRKWSEFMANGR